MSLTVDFGIPGLQVAPGDHVCAFYDSLAERDDVLLPFLRAGLAAGDKCICVVDANDLDAVVGELWADLGEVREQVEHQLEVVPVERVYLRTGAFVPDRMLDFWDDTVSSALSAEGFSFVRSVGDTTWALREAPGVVDQLIVYESRLNRFLPLYPQVILCLYDIGRFSGELIVDVVKTHPKLLVRGAIVENPDYLEPDEFLAARS
jgi:hypothetical protein